MTPATLAKANTEHSHQRALFAWLNMAARFGFDAAWDEQSYTVANHARDYYVVPGVEYQQPSLTRAHAIANGGQRDKITAGKLKAEGVKPGVPDIFLPLPSNDRRYCGLYVEMKRPKAEGQRAGSTSDDQDGWIAYLRSVGYAVSVCFTWEQAAKEIQSYVEHCGG
jgi:hypothetical protein